MTLDDFVKKYDGKGIDFDNKFSTQCVDLYRQYVKEVLGFPQSPSVEGAKDIWDTYLPEYYKRIENTPYGVPEKGDIVIWGTKIGKYGHVAIFLEGDAKKFKSFDQNYPTGTLCHIQEHTYTGVLGWLRPITKSMELPDWFKTLLQERGLSLDREGEFRAFFEKAVKYDNDIQTLTGQVTSLSASLSDRAGEVSLLSEQNERLRNERDAAIENFNQERDKFNQADWEAKKLEVKVKSLEEEIEKLNSELSKANKTIEELKASQYSKIDEISPLKLIIRGLVRIFSRR